MNKLRGFYNYFYDGAPCSFVCQHNIESINYDVSNYVGVTHIDRKVWTWMEGDDIGC